MTIKEVAQRYHLTQDTLRYYSELWSELGI